MTDNTHDLSKYGYRELRIAAQLLNAYRDGDAPFLGDGVQIEFNPTSGCVFLIDEDYNTAMINGDDLEQFFYCSECGTEGFLEDMLKSPNGCCKEYLIDIEAIEGDD